MRTGLRNEGGLRKAYDIWKYAVKKMEAYDSGRSHVEKYLNGLKAAGQQSASAKQRAKAKTSAAKDLPDSGIRNLGP